MSGLVCYEDFWEGLWICHCCLHLWYIVFGLPEICNLAQRLEWYCLFIQGLAAFRIHITNIGKSVLHDSDKYCCALLLDKNMTCKDIKT